MRGRRSRSAHSGGSIAYLRGRALGVAEVQTEMATLERKRMLRISDVARRLDCSTTLWSRRRRRRQVDAYPR
jgi:hypothetical protein